MTKKVTSKPKRTIQSPAKEGKIPKKKIEKAVKKVTKKTKIIVPSMDCAGNHCTLCDSYEQMDKAINDLRHPTGSSNVPYVLTHKEDWDELCYLIMAAVTTCVIISAVYLIGITIAGS